MLVNYSTAAYFIRFICHFISVAGSISFTSLLPHLLNKNLKDLRMWHIPAWDSIEHF